MLMICTFGSMDDSHLEYIRWAVYQRDPPTPVNIQDRDGDALEAKPSVGEIACILRSKGYFVTVSRDPVAFWIFVLSICHPDSPDAQQAKIAHIIEHHDFKR
ncbi:MAG: hypothetical protein Q9204_001326 [Flavoplaca sp. TL-2023a]